MELNIDLLYYIKKYKPTAQNPLRIGRFYPGDDRLKINEFTDDLIEKVMREYPRHPKLIDLSEDASVSRNHALVWEENNYYWIEDANSKYNTLLNGQEIRGKGKQRIGENDVINIRMFRFFLKEPSRYSKQGKTTILVEGVRKTVKHKKAEKGASLLLKFNTWLFPKRKTILHTTFLDIKEGEFVVVMGPSGCGKSTLMKIMCGESSATAGTVTILRNEITANWKYIKRQISYVPQDNILHEQLTVIEELRYAARLRMGDDVSEETREKKIKEVLSNLKINKDDYDKKIIKLSGGQKKRVCIAIELLIDPLILFLDEPTSPLDPETIEDFLIAIRNLKEKGTTIVMVTHKPEDMKFADKVVFLGKDGYPAFFGKESDLKNYFNYNERLFEIYVKLSNDPKQWNNKYKTQYTKELSKITHPTFRSIRRQNEKNESAGRQLINLTKRTFLEKTKDQKNMLTMLLIPLIIPVFIFISAHYLNMSVLLWSAIASIFSGIFMSCQEVLREESTYRREKMFNLRIWTYLTSKLIVFSTFSFIQALLFTLMLFIKYNFLSSDEILLENFFYYYLYVALITFSASLIGLLLSALFSSAAVVMNIMSIILIVQIVFSGVLSPIKDGVTEKISYLMLSRWGAEGLARIHSATEEYNVKVQKMESKLVYIDTTLAPGVTVDSFPKKVNTDIGYPKTDNRSVYSKTPVVEKNMFNRTIYDPVTNTYDTVAYTTNMDAKKRINPLTSFNYDNYEDGENENLDFWFDSIEKNILAIMILNVIIFIALWYAVKKKSPL